MEARYYRSAAPPIELFDVPLENAVATLEAKHGVKISVDWPSVTKASGLEPKTKVDQNLQDGSLSWAVERIFFGHAIIEGTDLGILIRARDPERDGPRKPEWESRFERKQQSRRDQQVKPASPTRETP
jgi:hypothetical protein